MDVIAKSDPSETLDSPLMVLPKNLVARLKKHLANVQPQMATAGNLQSLQKLFGNGKTSPYLWLVSAFDLSEKSVKMINRRHCSIQSAKSIKPEMVELESFRSPSGTLTPEIAIELLSIAGTLRKYSAEMDSGTIGDIVQTLLQIEREYGSTSDNADPLLTQLVSVELPLTVAYQILVNKNLKQELTTGAVKCMESLVFQLLDGDGLISATHWHLFGPLVSSWSRCWSILQDLTIDFDPEKRLQLEWAVRQTLASIRPDGTLLGSPAGSMGIDKEFAGTLLRMSSDRLDKKIARNCLPINKVATNPKPINASEISSASEWAGLVLMQKKWKRYSAKVGVGTAEGRMTMDVCRKVGLIQGDVTPQVSLNGKVLKAESTFEFTCWQTNDDLDYLELEIELEDGVTLERQILFAREDDFLYVADVIYQNDVDHDNPARIDYACEFPFASGTSSIAETETTEVYLQNKKIHALAIPVSLPEWKADPSDDELKSTENGLQLTQSRLGDTLYAAMLFDLKPNRSVQPRTWRKLTVGESLEIVGDDVAVAYRVQVGESQWLFYRSIGEKGNRTFMGENFAEDTCVVRFYRDGQSEMILEIE